MNNYLSIALALFLMGSAFVCAEAQDANTVVQQPFNGIVTDLAGNPIRKVKAYIKSPTEYALSDRKGRFGFDSVTNTDTIRLLYKKEVYLVPVGESRGMRIRLGDQLNAEAVADKELADLGYGFVKRRQHTGASTGITREELLSTGQVDLLSALRSRVPGLNITKNDGQLGSKKPTVYIRGLSSVYGDPTPLYLVDGVQVQSIDNISIYSVEYVEVIKDANIYGAQGGNGVISVHTIGHVNNM